MKRTANPHAASRMKSVSDHAPWLEPCAGAEEKGVAEACRLPLAEVRAACPLQGGEPENEPERPDGEQHHHDRRAIEAEQRVRGRGGSARAPCRQRRQPPRTICRAIRGSRLT